MHITISYNGCMMYSMMRLFRTARILWVLAIVVMMCGMVGAQDVVFDLVKIEIPLDAEELFPTDLAVVDDTLYMAGALTGALYRFDLAGGTATRVGNTEAFGVNEMFPTGIATIGSTLYMVGSNARLYEVNLSDGVATQVGKDTGFGVGEELPFGLAAIDNTLYMVGSNARLYEVDTTMGVAKRVGRARKFGVGSTAPTGLAAIGDTLYMVGIDTASLFSLNATTGVATVSQEIEDELDDGLSTPMGLASIENTLYMVSVDTELLIEFLFPEE